MLATYVHDMNPVIFRIGFLEPRWYGFAYLCGFAAAFFILKWLARKGMLRLAESRVADLVLNCCIFGVLVGGRLGYVLFYDPSLLKFSSHFPYWGVFEVWHGGMSAHGGILFTILALMFFGWKNKISIINIGDAACMVVTLGLLFGRGANFVNGELYGRPTDTAWGVKFPTEFTSPTNNKYDPMEVGQYLIDHQPAAVVQWAKLNGPENIETIEDVKKLVAAGKLDLGKMAKAMQEEDIARLMEWAKSSEQLKSVTIKDLRDVINQLQQGSPEVKEPIRMKFAAMASLPPRHPSQIYQGLLEGAALFAIVWVIGMKWRWDGMASGAFLTLYPVMRIIGEQFRVGDTPVTILGITCSLGVWYSVATLAAGAGYWVYFIKKHRVAVWEPVKEEPVPKKDK